jgi:hypothetical protein
MSNWWIGTLCEYVVHQVPPHQLERLLYEYMAYSTAGWKRLLNVNYFFLTKLNIVQFLFFFHEGKKHEDFV